MKLLHFSSSKQPILIFRCEDVAVTPQGDGFLLQAHGATTFQDSALLEGIFHGSHPCTITVTEGEEEQMRGTFTTHFMELKEDFLAVQLTLN